VGVGEAAPAAIDLPWGDTLPGMRKRFNIAGPCHSGKHYMLPPEARVTEIPPLIEEEGYFVVHAPRQTGKTTSLRSLATSLTAGGTYAAVLTSCKVGESAAADVELAIQAIIDRLEEEARRQLPAGLRPDPAERHADVVGAVRLARYLGRWSERCPRPLVLFLDEIDSLVEEPLLSVLDQLHAGYDNRPEHFPHSVALILRRDTHLDSLVERLHLERVQRIVEPILTGELLSGDVLDDDFAFVRDLGLIRPGAQGLEIANPIYREIVPRVLTSIMELSLVLPRPSYVDAGEVGDADDAVSVDLDEGTSVVDDFYETGGGL